MRKEIRKRVHLETLHKENILWKSKLLFDQDELKILQGRLSEMLMNTTSMSDKARIESFQNQMLIHEAESKRLLSKIATLEHQLYLKVKANKEKDKPIFMDEQSFFQDDLKMFEKIFHELRVDFSQFTAQWWEKKKEDLSNLLFM